MPKSYNPAIDILRILAILGVILIHTTTRTLEASSYNLSMIPFTLFLNQLAIFSVPLFFLISGFVLELNHRNLNYVTYFKKRAIRIIVPYLFWSLFYFFAYPIARIPNASFFYLLLTGQASYQLYFIPAIILFYLLFPILHMWIKLLSKWYSILMISLIQLLLLYQDYYVKEFHIESALRVGLLCFGLFIIGMAASHYQEKIVFLVKQFFWVCIALVLLCILISVTESYTFFEKTKNIHYFYSQYHPIVFPYTLLLAGIVFSLFHDVQKQTKTIFSLSKLSFFVFFIHVSVIYTFWYSIGQSFFYDTRTYIPERILYDICFFLLVSISSFLIAFLIHKIPYASKLTG